MSKRRKTASSAALLDLWRPPQRAGDPIGCLATTFTFHPGLFDEQCLARFLEIESEPNREDLAFLLERESRLGSVYAGVLVDHTQAGVEHSLRWDVLPVRIPTGKQHAKISLLAWAGHIRIIVASANLTEPGYRTNYEVATAVELHPEEASVDLLEEAVAFLRHLLSRVPGASLEPAAVKRATAFLDQVTRQASGWKPLRRGGSVRQHLVCTLPAAGTDHPARSSLSEAVQACRKRGRAPTIAWVASPFFDLDEETSRVTTALCKGMEREGIEEVCFCVPAVRDHQESKVPRLAAPEALVQSLPDREKARVEILPAFDTDKNLRPWHAKMLALQNDEYSALMVGSSNFTCAGMGVGAHLNAEANLLTVIDRTSAREANQLEAVWPEMEVVADLDAAEWLGTQPDREEENQAKGTALPAGFLAATYRAGDQRAIILRFDAAQLPAEWRVQASGRDQQELLFAGTWREQGAVPIHQIAWGPAQPPEKLLVQWEDQEAFLPLNVEDSRQLPPPASLEKMSADDLLWILAAADPSAAFRAWAKRQQPSDLFDSDLDTALPIDLDPLRRYDLQATLLHRIRRRARILAQLRANLQRPVWGLQALEWRLRGLIGIEPLADRLAGELASASGSADEALLTLADFMIVLREVNYQPVDGALPKTVFDQIFRSFLGELAVKLRRKVENQRGRLSPDLMAFWERVLEKCQK